MPWALGGHRWTTWYDAADNVVQIAVACIDDEAEAVVEIAETVGPFDDLAEVRMEALARAHALGGWRAHQMTLDLT